MRVRDLVRKKAIESADGKYEDLVKFYSGRVYELRECMKTLLEENPSHTEIKEELQRLVDFLNPVVAVAPSGVKVIENSRFNEDISHAQTEARNAKKDEKRKLGDKVSGVKSPGSSGKAQGK